MVLIQPEPPCANCQSASTSALECVEKSAQRYRFTSIDAVVKRELSQLDTERRSLLSTHSGHGKVRLTDGVDVRFRLRADDRFDP
jgi:hypothetical protein